ncbi:hypothetical protein CIC12_26925 [Burkholderia sp. SG-MS1]|uniref:hypothetical protein n=1 Tax=Paraburkholderia sp. SG-MS1 TaxID=2023741 RepID=UPI0014470BCB|nr:hypothetical protein [Paraburkholderia sp. SG-MS1]
MRLCDQQREQLDKLVTLAASVCRSPAVTNEERAQQRTLLQLLVDTGEVYQRSNECDSQLFQIIALDAKGVAHSRITARDAANLLSDAVRSASDSDVGVVPRRPARTKAGLKSATAPH